jgi:hypothetical protein
MHLKTETLHVDFTTVVDQVIKEVCVAAIWLVKLFMYQ